MQIWRDRVWHDVSRLTNKQSDILKQWSNFTYKSVLLEYVRCWSRFCNVLQVGFDAGDGDNYFALPASDIINVASMSNVNIPGVFMFRVDSAENKQGRF
jgi:hypothetical protein